MDDFTVAVTVLSAVTGAVSVLVTSGEFIWRHQGSRTALKEAQEAEFQAAVTSDNLKVLGSYLYEKVGLFTVYDYASNEEVRSRVTKLMEGIRVFIGEPEFIDPPPKPSAPELIGVELESAALAAEFHQAQHDIRAGNIWNALARLRRAVEIHLRRMAEERQLPSERASAKQLLRLLVAEGVVSDRARARLEYAISVANRGVHGLDVSADQAEEALQEAAMGMRIIEAE